MPEFIQNWDLSCMCWLLSQPQLRTPLILDLAWIIAQFIGWRGFSWFILAGVMWLRKKHLFAAQMLIALGLGIVEIALMKGLINRPRPSEFALAAFEKPHTEFLATQSSFPSGHTALLIAGSVIIAHRYGYKDWRTWGAFTFSLMVGLARILQLQHWPSDVIATAFLGLIPGYLSLYIMNNMKVRELVSRLFRAVDTGLYKVPGWQRLESLCQSEAEIGQPYDTWTCAPKGKVCSEFERPERTLVSSRK